jgi:hypothetical protein
MKQLTKEEQEQAVELIELSLNLETLYDRNIYIRSAKAFLQSLKPKVYVCQNNCGFFYFFSKSVLNEDFVVTESDAHIFDSTEQAEVFIDEYKNKDYPLYVVMA